MRNCVIFVALIAIHSAATADEPPLPTAADVLKVERGLWYADMAGIIGDDGATDPDFSGVPHVISNLRCRAKGAERAFCRYTVGVHNKRHHWTAKRLLINQGEGQWTVALDGE